MQTSELMSALTDGQLGGEDFAAALQACRQDDSAAASWDTYHLIGEALRAPALPALGADMAFVARLNHRLAGESLAGPAAGLTHVPAPDVPRHHAAAANDSDFRWKLVAGIASLAAVSAIAWNAAGLLQPAAAPQLAQAPVSQQVLVASPQGPVVRDARLEELLAAHKQLGGTSALQEPSGFLRNATFEPPRNAGR
ncbi:MULTISPECIES: sigma-E factor negative regulatory protein [unclassified Polaromonas]|uniref:sigma-E factor negative regulatory protein n=1 Tax=unclassified Polaromonas TaxID=2638319 RepID=UPI001E595636|nr:MULTISPECIES: RseA family anti-sigma factor [unclassified Polaromonas]